MKFILTLLLLSVTLAAYSSNDSLRTELARLLTERKVLFDDYSATLSKKSGFFGNKTKNDLRDSQERLKEIVAADNKIIGVLNRTINYRNFEKVNMTYDVTSQVERIANLKRLNESLIKQNSKNNELMENYKRSVKKYKLYNWMLVAAIIGLMALLIRKYLRSS